MQGNKTPEKSSESDTSGNRVRQGGSRQSRKQNIIADDSHVRGGKKQRGSWMDRNKDIQNINLQPGDEDDVENRGKLPTQSASNSYLLATENMKSSLDRNKKLSKIVEDLTGLEQQSQSQEHLTSGTGS